MDEDEFQSLPKFGRLDPERRYLAEIARLTVELADAKERERVLREAVDNMPHEWGCAIFYSAGVKCSCWKRGALGEP